MLQSQRDFKKTFVKGLPLLDKVAVVNIFRLPPEFASKYEELVANVMHKYEGQEGRKRIATINSLAKGTQDDRRTKLAPRRTDIYELILDEGPLCTKDMLEVLTDITADTLRSDLIALLNVGVVKKHVPDNRTKPTVWEAIVDDISEASRLIAKTVTSNISYANATASEQAVVEYMTGKGWCISRDIGKHIDAPSRQVANTLMSLKADGKVESKKGSSFKRWRLIGDEGLHVQKDTLQDKILKFMEEGVWYKSPEIYANVDRHRTKVGAALNLMHEQGLVDKKPSFKNPTHFVWRKVS